MMVGNRLHRAGGAIDGDRIAEGGPAMPYRTEVSGEKTMESESARMTTAAQARYRIDYPNSRPRAVKVVALDAPAEAVVKRLAQGQWQNATFLTALKFDGAPRSGAAFSMKDWLSDLAGRTHDLIEEVATADLVVMVASAGTIAEAAGVIAEACGVRKVMTTALIIGGEKRSDEELSKTLASLRPYASMLVIANNDDYIEEMLVALRA
jgi:hypothetical protein